MADNITGRTYLLHGVPVVVEARWAGKGPRNVLLHLPDGSLVVRSFQRLRTCAMISGMGTKTTFVVQSFERKRGRLVAGARDVAPTQAGALKRAEALAGRLPGAAAICIVADEETGELASATVLGQFGEVPEEFAESLRDG